MKTSKLEINTTHLKTGRREVLKKTWIILGIIASFEFILFTLNLLRPGKVKPSTLPDTAIKIVGNVEDFEINTVTTDRVNKFYLVRQQDGAFLALSLMCSHLGCSISWDDQKNQFICPCHSSSFNKQGEVINSPAPRPLDYFPVIIEEGKVKIDLRQRTKRRKFENKQLTYAI
jgi:Rieske Fe-S protein